MNHRDATVTAVRAARAVKLVRLIRIARLMKILRLMRLAKSVKTIRAAMRPGSPLSFARTTHALSPHALSPHALATGCSPHALARAARRSANTGSLHRLLENPLSAAPLRNDHVVPSWTGDRLVIATIEHTRKIRILRVIVRSVDVRPSNHHP